MLFSEKSFHIVVIFHSILYLDATRMLGACCVCLSYNATCFILSESKNTDEEQCGHDICADCGIPINECPICRGNIISYLEVKDWA
jgi:hypothetical protein